MDTLKNPSENVRVVLILIYVLVAVLGMIGIAYVPVFIAAGGSPDSIITYGMFGLIAFRILMLGYFFFLSQSKTLLFTKFDTLDELEQKVVYKIIYRSYALLTFLLIAIIAITPLFNRKASISTKEAFQDFPWQLLLLIEIPILVGFYYDEKLID